MPTLSQVTLTRPALFTGSFGEKRKLKIALRLTHGCGMVEGEVGEFGSALELFEKEGQLIQMQDLGSLERAVNGYEQAFCLHALGQQREAHAALAEAFAQAITAGDSVTLGCLWRLAGDFARAEGRTEAAQDAYANASAQFTEAGDTAAVREIEERRSLLSDDSSEDSAEA